MELSIRKILSGWQTRRRLAAAKKLSTSNVPGSRILGAILEEAENSSRSWGNTIRYGKKAHAKGWVK